MKNLNKKGYWHVRFCVTIKKKEKKMPLSLSLKGLQLIRGHFLFPFRWNLESVL